MPEPTPSAKATESVLNSMENTTTNIVSTIFNSIIDFINSNLPLLGWTLLTAAIIISLGIGVPKIKEKITDGKSRGRIAFGILGIVLISFAINSCGLIEAIKFDTSKIHIFKYNVSTEDKLISEYANKYNIPIETLEKTVKEKSIKITDNTKQALENEARILSVKQ